MSCRKEKEARFVAAGYLAKHSAELEAAFLAARRRPSLVLLGMILPGLKRWLDKRARRRLEQRKAYFLDKAEEAVARKIRGRPSISISSRHLLMEADLVLAALEKASPGKGTP